MIEIIRARIENIINSIQEEGNIQNKEDIRVILKFEKGQLGAFVFVGSKFHRRLEWTEISNILI